MRIKIRTLKNQKKNYRLYFEKKTIDNSAVSISLFCMSVICERLLELSVILWTENFAKVDVSLHGT